MSNKRHVFATVCSLIFDCMSWQIFKSGGSICTGLSPSHLRTDCAWSLSKLGNSMAKGGSCVQVLAAVLLSAFLLKLYLSVRECLAKAQWHSFNCSFFFSGKSSVAHYAMLGTTLLCNENVPKLLFSPVLPKHHDKSRNHVHCKSRYKKWKWRGMSTDNERVEPISSAVKKSNM